MQCLYRSVFIPQLSKLTTLCRCYCESPGNVPDHELNVSSKKKGFAQAYEKFETLKLPPRDDSFATLMRNSKFIDLGDPEGKIVSGTIFHTVDDDLYIDFGGKFHCVCTRPNKNGSDYVRGARVKLRLKDLELSTKFLGAEKDLTLLEADATIIGLLSTPIKK